MLLIEADALRILFVHCAQCLNDPLMLGYNFILVSPYFCQISAHDSFDASPLVCHLIWSFYEAWCRKIYPFLDFVPFSFSKVENGYKELGNFNIAPLNILPFQNFAVSGFVDNVDFRENFVKYCIHFFVQMSFCPIILITIGHNHLFLLFFNFILLL